LDLQPNKRQRFANTPSVARLPKAFETGFHKKTGRGATAKGEEAAIEEP